MLETLREAERLREELGMSGAPFEVAHGERIREELRARLAADELAAAEARGRALDDGALITLAMGDDDGGHAPAAY